MYELIKSTLFLTGLLLITTAIIMLLPQIIDPSGLKEILSGVTG